jgi:hypothetical protein
MNHIFESVDRAQGSGQLADGYCQYEPVNLLARYDRHPNLYYIFLSL